MIAQARPSGRLPALVPNETSTRRRRYVEKWKHLVDGEPTASESPRAPLYEPSRYAGTDEEEDS